MKRFPWPRIDRQATNLMPFDHPNILRVTEQILDHGREGQRAFAAGRLVDARYHRDCISLLIWRLNVDGLTEDGQIKWDGAKYETRLPGRWSSEAARAIRNSSSFTDRAPSKLENYVVCDHIVPRNCVAETLVRTGWWDTHDADAARRFVFAHAEVAILAPTENERLDDKERDLRSKMPAKWWDATLSKKTELRFSRYEAAGIEVTRWVPSEHGGRS